MEICGVICEYNPFHSGHLFQLGQIRDKYPDAVIVSLMSGNFVQRGEGAIYPKYLRAKAAVKCGADLVLSLPYPYCGAREEIFAKAGVSVLNSLGTSVLCFGSESGGGKLCEVARRTASTEYQTALTAEYAQGKHENRSGVEIAQTVYERMYSADFPTEANDILGLEYCRAVLENGYPIKLCPLPRKDGWSAGESRKAIREGNRERMNALMPDGAQKIYAGANALDTGALGKILLALLRTKTPEELSGIAEITPGIGERISKLSGEAATYEALIESLVSKRESRAKIRRILLSAVNGVTEERLRREPAFTSLLAANKKGREALRMLSRRSLIPILTKPADYRGLPGEAREQFLFEAGTEALLCAAMEIPSSDLLRRVPYIG